MQLLAKMAFIFPRIFLSIFFGLFFSISCRDSNQPPSPTPGPQTTPEVKVNSLQDLIGYVLTCETQNGKAFVYAFAPHILGIWDNPQAKRIDYYISQFVTKKDELAYELLISGSANMQSQFFKQGDLKNRRILMRIRDNKIFVIVAHGLSEQDKSPIKPHQFECSRGPLVSESFNGP